MTFNSVLGGSAGAYFGYDTPSGGSFVLGNQNSYTGGTIVGAGTVVIQNGVNATGSGSVTVTNDPHGYSSAGVLTWNTSTATIGGNVTVASSQSNLIAQLGPSSGVSALHIGGTLTFGANSRPVLALSSAHNGANDQVAVTSSLNGGGVQVGIQCGTTLDASSDYVLFTSGGVTGNFSQTPIWTLTTPQYADQYTIVTSGNNVVLHFTPSSTPIAIIVTATANTKTYDGTTSAAAVPTYTGSLASGDTANFTESYSSKGVGTSITLTPSGTVSGGHGNYTYTYNTTTGTINQKPLTVTGLSVIGKAYDGTTAATLTGTAALPTAEAPGAGSAVDATPYTGDAVSLGGTAVATFGDANVGTGKSVTIAGLGLTGGDAANYSLTALTATADITGAETVTTLMSSSEAPVAPGVNVTFTATVRTGVGTPTGQVVFQVNGVAFSTKALAGGVAVLSTAALPLGDNIVAAEYAAQGNYQESNDSLEQVVEGSVTCSQTNGIVHIADNPDGTFTITFIGTPQAQYYVATSADASAPMSEWVPLPDSTITVTNSSGLWQVTVTNTIPQQYFRSAAAVPCSGGQLVGPVLNLIKPHDSSLDYGPAHWDPPCNANYYTSGYGHRFLVIHCMDGYYLSSISMFKSCGWSSASVHYLVNGLTDYSGDAAPGDITQMVAESNYAWHAMCWNRYSLGTEHEGFESNPAWFTDAQYNASGLLQRHLCDKFNIPRDRNHIIAHGQKSVSGWPAWASANLGINPNCNDHTDPGPYWDWTKFMSIINGDMSVAGPAAVAWAPGRMDVVVRGDGDNIFHKYYDYSRGGWLPTGHFENLGGYSTSDPAICSWAAQRLDVFCRGGDNALWHKWYNAGWSGWENLGGDLSSGPSAVSWGSRRIDVVVRGGGNNIYHKFYDYLMGGWLPKGDFENLGGNSASAPAICSSGPRRLDVFYRGSDNALWHKWFDSNGWSVWESLGGNFADNPDAVSWGPGRMDIVVRGNDSQVYHTWYDYNTGGWHGWESLGGTATSSPAVCSSGSGRLDVFCAGSDHALMHKWHDSNGWSGWENLGGVLQ